VTAGSEDQAARWLDAQLHLLTARCSTSTVFRWPSWTILSSPMSLLASRFRSTLRRPVITALLSGPVLATRIFGGRPPDSRMQRTPWAAVAEVGVVIKLAVDQDTRDAAWTERWVRDNVIGRIPGGRHVPEQEQDDHPQNEERGRS
jgi:hypothetical protein